jgi:hypothetical protein
MQMDAAYKAFIVKASTVTLILHEIVVSFNSLKCASKLQNASC